MLGFPKRDRRSQFAFIDEAMNFRGPALVNVVISQGSARKPQQFRWHS
jgi:hypothetical protein